jgi:hypothetical protein
MEQKKKKELTKTETLILLFILIAIGGVVLYGAPRPHAPTPTYETHR